MRREGIQIKRQLRTFTKKFKSINAKRRRSKSKFQLVLVLFGLFVLYVFMVQSSTYSNNYNSKPLLDIIAKGESSDNYNAYYGNPRNNSVDFTEMSVAEVIAWQKQYVEKGSPSSAVGRYQFIRPTLQKLVNDMKIDSKTKFTPTLQDKLAVKLLEKRGLNDFAKGKITREQFAYNLSKEWAALPVVIGNNPSQSYYAGDGLNKVQLSIDDLYQGIEKLNL
jgi:muramidase (phage lysozyme)